MECEIFVTSHSTLKNISVDEWNMQENLWEHAGELYKSEFNKGTS